MLTHQSAQNQFEVGNISSLADSLGNEDRNRLSDLL